MWGTSGAGGANAEPCTDEVLRGRFELYQGFDIPLIYTPGDNDWFDCVAESAGGYDEYERLAFLRGLFFPDPTGTTGGRSMSVRSQSSETGFEEFVENVLWTRGEVVYATVHLVALLRPPADPTVASRRLEAAVAWIDRAFQVARQQGSDAVFIATQVDPWVVWGLPRIVRQLCERCLDRRPGLSRCIRLSYSIPRRSLAPSSLRWATPTSSGSISHYTVTTARCGELYAGRDLWNPYVHWVRVTVDPSEGGVFKFHQELVPDNVAVTSPN